MFESLFSVVIIEFIFVNHARLINITDVNMNQNITCPSSELCQVICFAEHSCSNIEIRCEDNEYGCSVYCNTNACQYSKIYITNTIKSEIICADTNSASYSQSCRHSQFYINTKTNNSTVFIDIQSRIGYIDKIQINYNGNASFINDEILYHTNISTYNATLSVAIHPITILCRNYNSCRDSFIEITSLNYFKLHCLYNNSCYNLQIDFISSNNNHRGTLDMLCNGERACSNAYIHAITAHKFEMICDASIDSCSSVLVQCPITSTVIQSENSCIVQCMNDTLSCSNTMIYAMYGMIQLHNNNTNPMYVNDMTMYCGYDFNTYCIVGDDCSNICEPIQDIDTVQMILPFNDNAISLLQCDTDIFTEICIIFMNSEYIQSVQCGNSHICMVLCTAMDCGTNTIINASTVDTLRLQTLQHSNFQSIDLYGPIDGEFISNAALNTVTLYLSTSNTIEILCSSEYKCTQVSIFANTTNTININCHNSTCQYISLFVHNTQYSTSNTSPIPYCNLNWLCNDGCVNNTNTITIHTLYQSAIQCDIHTHDLFNNTWFCDEYILSSSCISLNNTTNTPWITSTQYINTNGMNTERITQNTSFWSETGGLLALGILICCCCVCILSLWITKKYVKKQISDSKAQAQAQSQAKHSHSRQDTIGSTVEDIIKESAALSFTNPLGIQITDNILNSVSPPPPPPLPPAPPIPKATNNYDDKMIDAMNPLQYNNYHKHRGSSRQSSNYVYGHPRSAVHRDLTVEGSMDLESRMNRYSSDMDMSAPNVHHAISRDSRHSSLGIAQDISNKRTFSSPSLVVLSIHENGSSVHHSVANGAENSSTEDSDGMYDSMSAHRDEGGNNTTTKQ